jgi:hypothetical protein
MVDMWAEEMSVKQRMRRGLLDPLRTVLGLRVKNQVEIEVWGPLRRAVFPPNPIQEFREKLFEEYGREALKRCR